ncbi:MAG: polysaccharide deacetylase family protein [Phycisphaerales bacterium]|nr:polysaccharide deacetylase family protein [Phycisphaerales bacterium]
MLPKHFIATYHYVRPTNSDGVTGITPEDFERQIKLISNTYTLVSADEFVTREHTETGLALITFDDAVLDQYRYATPILERLGVPATFYSPMRPFAFEFDDQPDEQWISQHLLHALAQELGWNELEQRFDAELKSLNMHPNIDTDRMNELYHYEVPQKRQLKFTIAFVLDQNIVSSILKNINRDIQLKARDWFMNREQLVNLQSRGFDLGGHGFDHLPYSTMSPVEQRADLQRSRDTLDRIAGIRQRTLAYPFGRSDNDTESIARELGYTRCFNTHERVDAMNVEQILSQPPIPVPS